MIENPFDISTYTFSDDTFSNATLYVPVGTIEKYKAKEGWKEFKNIIEGGNSVAQVGANAVLIQSESGRITVNGADDGTDICVYSTNGVLCGTAISHNGNAVVNTPPASRQRCDCEVWRQVGKSSNKVEDFAVDSFCYFTNNIYLCHQIH